MSDYPLQPDPNILIWFSHPRSQKEVKKIMGYYRETVYKHMRKARRMGLIHHVSTRSDGRGAPQQLYELTPKGVEYLEASDDE